jgi:hypothetical protein
MMMDESGVNQVARQNMRERDWYGCEEDVWRKGEKAKWWQQ